MMSVPNFQMILQKWKLYKHTEEQMGKMLTISVNLGKGYVHCTISYHFSEGLKSFRIRKGK